MRQFEKKILFDPETIAKRVKALAAQISAKYPEGDLLMIGILKGSFMFLADLMRDLTVPCQVDFARIASYGNSTVSSGKLEIVMDVKLPVKDRAVIIVDDIVDTGLTLSEYRKRLATAGPRSLETAALIDKVARRDKQVELDYCGFQIDDGFVVGYGLDCDEQFRHLPGIWVLE